MRFKLNILRYLLALKIGRLTYRVAPRLHRKNQTRRFLKQLSQSPFYRDLARSGTDLSHFPLLNKKQFVENFDTLNTCGIQSVEAVELALKAEQTRDFQPMIRGITIGLSSGTSGNRGLFLASGKERARWVACMLDRVIGFSLRKRKIAFFLRADSNLYRSVESVLLEFHYFDLLLPIPENLKRLQQVQPDILIAQPSMLLEIADAINRNELHLSPRRVISVAEVLTPEDNTRISNCFGQVIHQVYQCTEGFLAHTCEKGTLHFNEDFLIIEKNYLDSGHKRFHPVITDLCRTSQPVIRYELNDILQEQGACSCGSNLTPIGLIEGRSDDMLLFQTRSKTMVKLFPDFFRRAIITADKDIEDYTLTQKSPERLELFIGTLGQKSFDSAVRSIQTVLTSYHIEEVRIIRTDQRNLEPGSKLRRIKNEMQKSG